MGITTILASICSLNEGRLAFHQKNGFQECGRFRDVGIKRGRSFDYNLDAEDDLMGSVEICKCL